MEGFAAMLKKRDDLIAHKSTGRRVGGTVGKREREKEELYGYQV